MVNPLRKPFRPVDQVIVDQCRWYPISTRRQIIDGLEASIDYDLDNQTVIDSPPMAKTRVAVGVTIFVLFSLAIYLAWLLISWRPFQL